MSDTGAPNLQTLKQRIIDSGALGRSPVYVKLLDYLTDCAADSRQPKEFEIAVDVLGRDSSFDVSRDSVVRVYIHQLRKRLEAYYVRHEPNADYRIVIPKGQYIITLEACRPDTPAASREDSPERRRPARLTLALLALIAVLGAANAWQWSASSGPEPVDSLQATLSHPMWQQLTDDELPILLVMGDYYIFGELDEEGRISRMVRDFFINSSEDLTSLFMQDSSLQNYFRDLDMTYMPEGSADAMLQVAPILRATGKPVRVTMMSRLQTADLRNNHIIYIGYISALDKLNNLYFQTSGLLPGRTFDEIFDKQGQTLYTSTAGLPQQGQPFRDLALLATWPGANQNQFVLVTGTRDAGLMHAADVVSDIHKLSALDSKADFDTEQSGVSHEALFEVYGIDRMNFEANLLYHQPLDPALIWANSQ
ncbi:hypothetical protein [Pseudohongiella acticola]|uniref:hypothetical protein n=1 Tax=Pseudohongiella acticola TaxID=1524254 RepID=UPI0030ED459A